MLGPKSVRQKRQRLQVPCSHDKNLLSSSKLDTTTKPSPRAYRKNRVRNSFPLGGKPDDLFSLPTPMPGYLPVPPAWMVLIVFSLPESSVRPLPVFSVNRCSLILSRALFASKPWIYKGIIPFAARSLAIELHDTIVYAIWCSS